MRSFNVLAGLASLIATTLAAAPALAQPKPDPCSGEPAAPPADADESKAIAPTAEPEPSPPPPAPELAAASAGPAAPTVDLGGFKVTIGGYFQPQLRFKQNDPVAPGDEDGFDVRRARVQMKGRGSSNGIDVGVDFEAETTPAFSLLDADVFAAKNVGQNGQVKVTAGQFKAPFSRQTLLSDSNLAFVDKAQLGSLGPDRQIGAALSLRAPGAPWLQASGGVFDGEGKDQPQNLDEHFMYLGRVEIRPYGWDTPLQESGFFDFLTIGGSIGHNTLISGDGEEKDLYLGADISGAWHGLSGTVEYLQINRTFLAGSAQPSSHANGDVAQVSYLLPLAGTWSKKVEIGARVEEIDRNDVLPIVSKGDPNQSLRYYTVGLSYYHWKHALKLQLTASHIQELEDQDRTGADASYDNDQILIQATYKLE